MDWLDQWMGKLSARQSVLFMVVFVIACLGLGLVLKKNVPWLSQEYGPAEASENVGKIIVAGGWVQGVTRSKKGYVYLNFGEPYPRQTFTAVIFPEDVRRFPKLPSKGDNVYVSGLVELFRGKPQIRVKDVSQFCHEPYADEEVWIPFVSEEPDL